MKLKSSNSKIYLGGIYLAVLCIAIYFLFSTFDIKDLTSYEFIKENREIIIKYKDNNIFFLTIIFFIITILLNLLLCPMLLPTLIIGFIFGKWLGTLILIFGNTLGGLLLYQLAKTFFSDLIEKKFKNNSYKPNSDKFDLFKGDRFLYHLLSRKFDFDDSSLITKSFSSKMFLKILAIRLIPLLTILIGSILALKILWTTISLKKFGWQEIKSLDLELIDMVLLIAGGFVVLGEVVSPLFSISLVELFSKNISNELSQSLKIFFGYLFMAIPPLWIVFYQIKSLNGEFTFKKDYLQFNLLPIKYAIIQGIKGWLTIVPFVLLISLIMNSLIDNLNGSNPLLEIVLNNNNYLSFFLLFVTTTLLAPLFEEIIFRGILLPTLSRDFGVISGIIVSAFIFALAHLSLGEMPPLFVLGIGLGITRIASGSLFSSVIMHSLWNGLTFLNLFLLRT